MQELVVLMIVAIVGIGAVVAALATTRRRGRITRMQVAVGAAVGLVAAFAMLVAQVDLIADGPDEVVQRVIAVALTAVAVLGSWYRIARA